MGKEEDNLAETISFHTELIYEWLNEFKSETDRAAVILGAAKLDLQLRELLAKKLIPNAGSVDELLDTDRPLSTFSARINVAYRLALIDKQFAHSLHLIRRWTTLCFR